MFWVWLISVLGLTYTYAGYPAVVYALARLWPHPVSRGPFSGTTSVVLAARNEAAVLPDKIKGLLAVAEEGRIGDIWIGLDGCTDGSLEKMAELFSTPDQRVLENLPAHRWEKNGVRITAVDFPKASGKSAVLGALIPHVSGDVVFMMDARQRLGAHCLPTLLECFADEQVGVASAEMVYDRDANAAEKGAASYWGYEKGIRLYESSFDSVPGATGACYAIRRDALKPVPAETLLDDVWIPMRAVLDGFRCVFVRGAVVVDTPTQTHRDELARKRRTLAGVLQLFAVERRLFSPRQNRIWFQWMSHKVLRLFTPFLTLGFLAGALALAWQCGGLWVWLAGLSCAGVAVSAAAYSLKERGGTNRLLGLLGAFWMVNAAIVGAWADVWRGRLKAAWKP